MQDTDSLNKSGVLRCRMSISKQAGQHEMPKPCAYVFVIEKDWW